MARKKPRRLFRNRPPVEPLPPVPEEIADLARRLGGAWKVIDPAQVYRLDLGNGEVIESTGKELLESANAARASVAAQQRGDREGLERALARMGLIPASDRK